MSLKILPEAYRAQLPNMNHMKTKLMFIVALTCTLHIHAQTQTPGSVDTRLGKLTFENGYPTAETSKKVFDEIDYQRAVQAFMWATRDLT